MKTTSVASALFVAAAVAQPHGNGHRHQHAARAIVTETTWVTRTEFMTEVLDSTATYYVLGGSTSTAYATPSAAPTLPYNVTLPSSSSLLSSTSASSFSALAISASIPTTSATSLSTSSSSSISSSSSLSSAEPLTTSSSTTFISLPSPSPSTTSSIRQLIAIPSLPAVPTLTPTSASAAAPSATAASGGSVGGIISGQITYYVTGQGSCGGYTPPTDTPMIVAPSWVNMNNPANPNENPLCGKTITITAPNGNTAVATIVDTCAGCPEGNIDVSPGLFIVLFGSLTGGRLDCTWHLND